MKKTIRSIIFGCICLWFCLSSPLKAQTFTLQHDILWETQNQNMWGPNGSPIQLDFDYNLFHFGWDTTLSFGHIENFFGAQFGATFDLVSALKEVEGDIRNKITIRMHFSHFIPFQKTPLWNAPFNFSNYRDWCLDHKVIYESGNVRLFSGGTFTPSPSQAAISTILQRAKNTDTWIVERIASRDFQKIDSQRQIRIMKKEIPRFFCEQTEESIGNIKTANKYKAIRRAE